jgi:hypothetical protein
MILIPGLHPRELKIALSQELRLLDPRLRFANTKLRSGNQQLRIGFRSFHPAVRNLDLNFETLIHVSKLRIRFRGLANRSFALPEQRFGELKTDKRANAMP